MLSAGDANRGALIRGIDPGATRTASPTSASTCGAATLDHADAGRFNIVLGAELARALGVRVGDQVVAITPQGTVTPGGSAAAPQDVQREPASSRSACSSSTAGWR